MWNNPIDDTSTYTSCTNYSREAVSIIATWFHDLLSYFLLPSFISVFKTGHQSVSSVETVWLNSCSVSFVHQCKKQMCRTSFKLFLCWLHKGRGNELLKVKTLQLKNNWSVKSQVVKAEMPRKSAVLAKSRNGWDLPVLNKGWLQWFLVKVSKSLSVVLHFH